MTTISLKVLAEQLGKDLENLSEEVESDLNAAIQGVAEATYARIVQQAQEKLKATRGDFLKGLNFTTLGNNSYLISLEGEFPNMLETGAPGFDMKKTLLSSTKTVSKGARAGEPWVRESQDGNKYAAVPFEHKIGKATSGDLAQQIKNMTAMNRSGVKQKLSKVFTDEWGKPLQGKVATAESPIANLNKMVKYQEVNDSGKVSSVYMTYRMISEKSSGWMHPGFDGIRSFEEAEQYVEQELERVIKDLLE